MPSTDIDKVIVSVKKSTDNLLQTAGEIVLHQLQNELAGLDSILCTPNEPVRAKMTNHLEAFEQNCDDLNDIVLGNISRIKAQLQALQMLRFEQSGIPLLTGAHEPPGDPPSEDIIKAELDSRLYSINKAKSVFHSMAEEMNKDLVV